MSSFVQAQPVVYGTPHFAGKYETTVENCYYAAVCHAGQTVVQDTPFYGSTVDQGRSCYLPGAEYEAGRYAGGQQGPRYAGAYGQQQQQQSQMFISEYHAAPAHDAYRRAYCTTTATDQLPPRRSVSEQQYTSSTGEELTVRPTGNSPSAGVVPAATSPPIFKINRFSPPSAPPAANAPQPPVIYPWMKMVHSISGKLISCIFHFSCFPSTSV